MSEQPRHLPLRQLTRGGRPAPEFGEVSPAKALRLALAKAGQEVLSQVVDGSGIEERRVTLPKIPDVVSKDGLTIIMDGPGGGRGLVSLDRISVAAITEGLTTGRISSEPPSDRRPSVVDALLCQRFLVTVMTVFAAKLVGHPGAGWATGFIPEDSIDDLRRLPILLDDEPYRVLTIETDFAGGARIGQMSLVLPWDGRHAVPGKTSKAEPAKDAEANWSETLEQAVMPTEAVLEAVLYRMKLTLSDVSAFKVGSLIPIPRRAVAQVSLEDSDGDQVSVVRLGQSQGWRAVRFETAALRNDLSPTMDLDEGQGAGQSSAPPPFSLAGAMASAPGIGAAGMEMPTLDLDGDDDEEFSTANGLPDLPDLSSLADDAEPMADLPPLDLDSMPMTDLDDLPMTIE